jgi:hypothetical protein
LRLTPLAIAGLVVACRPTRDPSPPSPRPDARPEARAGGCLSAAAIATDAVRLGDALHHRFGGEWATEVTGEHALVIARTHPSTPIDDGLWPAVFALLRETFPDVLLADEQVIEQRGPGRLLVCRMEAVRADIPSWTRHVACVTTSDDRFEGVWLHRSRRFPAFAPLLRVVEDRAAAIALDHGTNVLHLAKPMVSNTETIASCDALGRATSLAWHVELSSVGGRADVFVDAFSGAVVDAHPARP